MRLRHACGQGARDVRPWISAFVFAALLPVAAANAATGIETVQADFAANQKRIESAKSELDTLRKLASAASQSERALQDIDAAELGEANNVFATKSQSMSPRQLALASYQIDAVTAAIHTEFRYRTGAISTRGVDPSDKMPPSELANEARTFSRLLLKSEKARQLKVLVQPGPSGRPPAPMTVYVLPLGLVGYGKFVDDAKLLNLLKLLSFEKPTSPSVGSLEPGIKYAIWIGPMYAFEKMVDLIRDGQVKKYAIVDASPATLQDIAFAEAVNPNGGR
jgi:hypothetical protein